MKILLAPLLALAACGGASAGGASSPQAPAAKLLQINRPGELVDIEAQVPGGHVTVVDFWGEHCGACEVVGAQLEAGVQGEPAIVIRKVDVGDGFTPVAEHYKIGALPHFRVYDKHRRMRYVLVGNDTLKASEIAKQLLQEK